MKFNNKNILLSAFGIHTGGGLVLLEAIFSNVGSQLEHATLDIRLKDNEKFKHPTSKISYVKKNFFSRILSLFFLANKASSNNVLFCFNSLPPFLKPSCKVIIFVQAPHFANLHYGIDYSFVTRIRIWIERQWFRFGIRNCDEIWVQSRSMADAIRVMYSDSIVRVMPFVDDVLMTHQSQDIHLGNINLTSTEYIFFYPADAVGHKNHINLLKAWINLASEGCFPKLFLTLLDEEIYKIEKNIGFNINSLTNIKNLGRVKRSEVLIALKNSSALIFPSLAETFGLPMLEASNLGIPIIASEKDFVWDVCTPIETFDPNSPKSIARAVRRFMSEPEDKISLLSASEILSCLYQNGLVGQEN